MTKRKNFMVITISILFAIALALPTMAADKTTRLTTLDWPPYIGQDLDGQGYVAEVVRAAFKEAGYTQAQLVFLEWTETVRLAKAGKADAYFPEYYSDSLKADFDFSDPMPGGALVLLKLKGSAVNYTGKAQDLKPYKLGVVAGYVNTQDIDSADYIAKVEAESDEANLKNLIAKKADVIVIDQLTADLLLKGDLFSRFTDKLEVIDPILEVKPLYLAFSKKSPNMPGVKDDFNKGLAALNASGKMDEILKKYGVSDKVSVK